MRKILAVVLTGLSMASIACGKDSTGPATIPADAMNGLYIGSTSNADIRLQVAYGVDQSATDARCAQFSGVDRVLCLLFAENLYGTGSITLRETGDVQSFQFAGLQATRVAIIFHQQNGVMAGTELSGSMSSDAATLQATIYPGAGTPRPSFFGDSAAVTFVRQ